MSDDKALKLFHEIASPTLREVVKRMTMERLTTGVRAKELYDAIAIAIVKTALLIGD